MSFFQKDLWISTRGRALLDITDAVNQQVSDSQIAIGLCHIFCAHTSASLTLTENADPRVHDDLEEFMARLAPAEQRTEYFGFLALTGKATTFLGPFAVATVTIMTGNMDIGMMPILVFWLVGLLFMLGVKDEVSTR